MTEYVDAFSDLNGFGLMNLASPLRKKGNRPFQPCSL